VGGAQCVYHYITNNFSLPCPASDLKCSLFVLLQIVQRKRMNDQWEEYCALIDKATALLLAKTAEMGILVPPGQMSQGTSVLICLTSLCAFVFVWCVCVRIYISMLF